MKYILCFVFIMFSVFAFADCTTLYSTVTYAFSHSRKSLKTNNFDHQRYYAKWSMEAIKKAEEQLGSCDCTKAGNIIYNIEESLEKAMDPEDWDTGRFYVKRARTFFKELITALEMCLTDTDPVPAEVPDAAKEEDYKEKTVEGENVETPAEKQMVLKREQEALIAQQKKRVRKLEEQRLLEQRLKEERVLELDKQRELMVKAEIGLYKMESAAAELIRAFSCEGEFSVTGAKRNEEVLENESLRETRDFYKEKFREIMEKILKELNTCTTR